MCFRFTQVRPTLDCVPVESLRVPARTTRNPIHTNGTRDRGFEPRMVSKSGGSDSTSWSVVRSLLWAAGQNTVGRIIQLTMFVILARLIGPEEVGLIGIVLL